MKERDSRAAWLVLNLLGFIGVLVVNALSTTIPLGGMSPGELSDQYPNLFVPAGLTFSIWGVIYLALLVFIVYSFVAGDSARVLGRIGILFFATCVENAGWIFAWQYRVLPLSLVVMLLLLATLIVLYTRLGVGLSNAAAAEKWCVHLPVSLYLGWISVATIANVTALLVAYRWDRFGIGEQPWTVVVVAVAIALALVMLFTRRDIFYSLVIDWALLGILLKRLADASTPSGAVKIAVIAGMCLVTAGIIVQIARGAVYRGRPA